MFLPIYILIGLSDNFGLDCLHIKAADKILTQLDAELDIQPMNMEAVYNYPPETHGKIDLATFVQCLYIIVIQIIFTN